MIGGVSAVLPLGKLYGLFNAKTLYIGSVTLFMAGSALCGAAPNIDAFIIGRVIAGAGGNGMYLGVLTLLSVTTTEKERPVYLSLVFVAPKPMVLCISRDADRGETIVASSSGLVPSLVLSSAAPLRNRARPGVGASISTCALVACSHLCTFFCFSASTPRARRSCGSVLGSSTTRALCSVSRHSSAVSWRSTLGALCTHGIVRASSPCLSLRAHA